MTDLVNLLEREVFPVANWEHILAALNTKKRGDYYTLDCPACNKHSAYLYQESGFVQCNRRNNCGHSFSVLSYLNGGSDPRGTEFIEVARDLAQMVGVSFPEKELHTLGNHQSKRSFQQEVLEKFWTFCTGRFPDSPAQKYLAKRSIPQEKGVYGYYPSSKEVYSWAQGEGVCQQLKEFGLIRSDFDSRLLGICRDRSGRVSNFWARSLGPSEKKYLFLRKHDQLNQHHPYGAHLVRGDKIIWVEGLLDVAAAKACGVENVVSCGSCNIPEKTFLSLPCSQAILALDNDKAGMDGTFHFISRHGGREDLDILVVDHHVFSNSKDLCELHSKEGKEAVVQLFCPERLIDGFRFAARHIIERHGGTNGYSDSAIQNSLKMAIEFAGKVSTPKGSLKLCRFFWPEIQGRLELDSCTLEKYLQSAREEQKREQSVSRAKRRLHRAMNLSSEGDLSAAVDELSVARTELNEIVSPRRGELFSKVTREGISEELKQISKGVSSGFRIDDTDVVFPGGAISIVAAPTSHGKTTALVNFCLGAMKENPSLRVGFVSLEESRAAIVTRFLNTYISEQVSKHNLPSIRSCLRERTDRYVSEEKRVQFNRKVETFFSEFFDVERLSVFSGSLYAEELADIVSGAGKEKRFDLICVDYIQLLRMCTGRFSSRQEELKHICLLLKDAAIEGGTPLLMGAQFNRQVVAECDLSPTNIREAGDIEQIANLILGFWNRQFVGFCRDGNKSKDGRPVIQEPKIYIEILKNRDGASGKSDVLHFDGALGTISQKRESHRRTDFGWRVSDG